MTAWTRFMDMHSGGGVKVGGFEYIYIQAPEEKAKQVFIRRFNHDPENVTCECCGQDYSISEEKSLAQATAHERNCEFNPKANKYVERQREDHLHIRKECRIPASDTWGLYVPLKDYVKRRDTVCIIRKDESR